MENFGSWLCKNQGWFLAKKRMIFVINKEITFDGKNIKCRYFSIFIFD